MSRRRSPKTRRPGMLETAYGFTAFYIMIVVYVVFLSRSGLATSLNLTTIIGGGAVVALIWALALFDLHLHTRRDLSLTQLKELAPSEFEEWVAQRYRERGYAVKLTGMGGDHGADLLAEKPGELVVVQCKKYRDYKVGEPTLRDLYGAMHDYGANRASLVTTGELTGPARRWAEGKPIEIWDGNQLARLARVAAPTPAPEAATIPAPEAARTANPPAASAPQAVCPRCGASLVVRRNRRTGEPFLGCPEYPRCRHTQPLAS